MEVTLAVAALAGLGSFVAPCILPMIPAFLAYISGTTITELNQRSGSTVTVNRSNVVLNAVFFVLGFSVVFSILGVVINSVLAGSASELIGGFSQIGGVIIIAFGAFLILTSRIRSLNVEKKFFPKEGKGELSYVLYIRAGVCGRLDSVRRADPGNNSDTGCHHAVKLRSTCCSYIH